MSSKPRIQNLSTRYLGFYKFGVAVVLASFVVGFFVSAYTEYREHGRLFAFLNTFTWCYLIYIWFRVNRAVHYVEFDEEYLYVRLKQQDLLIPLQNIKDINLVSMGGVYRVDLYAKELTGNPFYFKPSLLYPFNHKTKEAVVDLLWQNIDKAKTRPLPDYRNTLAS